MLKYVQQRSANQKSGRAFIGDMCLDLRSNAVFSQMLLEANMREIGIASDQVRLSEEQKDALKLALDDKVRAIALVGPLGSGKTIVGSEIIKIWMAIWMSRHTDVSTEFQALTFNLRMKNSQIGGNPP